MYRCASDARLVLVDVRRGIVNLGADIVASHGGTKLESCARAPCALPLQRRLSSP